jgi:CheY-like chemotaxis protein
VRRDARRPFELALLDYHMPEMNGCSSPRRSSRHRALPRRI